MRRVAAVALFLLLAACAFAQWRRDPLTDREADQLRESNYEPEKRIKLFIDFANTRLTAIGQLRQDTKAEGRNQKIHDLVEDFGNIVEELDDNLDMYDKERHNDIRKSLRAVIEADSDWQVRLRGLKQESSPDELKDYGIALDDATDSVNESVENAREILKDQEASAGASKKEKKQ